MSPRKIAVSKTLDCICETLKTKQLANNVAQTQTDQKNGYRMAKRNSWLRDGEMFSFTILLTVFCLVYLPYTNCEKADGYVQQRNFVGVTAETIERSVKHDSSAKGETTSNRKKTSQGGKNINPAKNSSSPAIIRPKRQKRESKYDLLHGMYTAYNFNWHFESFSLKDASSKKYSEVRNSFEPMVDEIISENQLPDLTSNHGPTWRALNESLVESYYDERGVIVFDQEFFRWVYCGWLIIDSDNIRMCAPLLPLGLKDIERNALKNSDYIPKDTAKFAYALSKGQKKSGKSSSNGKSKKDGDGMLAGLRKIVSKLMTVRIDYLLVNLFADNADTYNENCVGDRTDCDPICCYSMYIGSSFCTEQPMNCIYFRG